MHRAKGDRLVRVQVLPVCDNDVSCIYFSCFLVNSADRIIRVYESGEVLACGKDGEPEPIQKLQDLVNRYIIQYTNSYGRNSKARV